LKHPRAGERGAPVGRPAGSRELAELARVTHWAQTPLGPIAEWPVSLKTAAGLMLASRFPMALLWGPELVRLYNEAYRPLLGADHPAAMGRPARDALRDRWEASQPLYRQVMDAGESVFLSEKFSDRKTDDGAVGCFVTICYSPVFAEDGRVGGVLVTVVDDTPQVSARRRLEASETRYRILFDSIDEGFCIIEMIFDAEGRPIDYRFVETNPAFEIHTGVTGARGRTVRELLPQHETHWFEIYGEVALTGQAVRFRQCSEALGRWFDVYAFRCGAVQSREVAVLFRDITLQVETEEALGAGHRRLRGLSDGLERLSQSDSCRELQDELLRAAHQLAGADGVSVVLDFGEKFSCDGRRIPDGAIWNDCAEPLVLTLAEWTLSNRRTAVVADVADDPRLAGGVGALEFRRSLVMVPVGGTKLSGAIAAYWFRPREPDEEEVGALEVLARAAGTALDRQLASDRLRESEERFRVLVEETAQAVWEGDAEGRGVSPSPSWSAYTGQTPDEMSGYGWLDVIHSDDRAYAEEQWRRAVATGQPMNAEFRIWQATGECRWTNVRAAPIRDADGRIRKWVGMNIDVTDRKRAEQRVREAALHDPLTGLPNRRLMFEYAGHLLAAAGRKHSQGALLFIDLDRFKPVNDMYGHEAGDLLLQEVSKRLVGCVRREDLVGRLGGDEFVILLPYLEQMHDALSIAENVVHSVSKSFRIRNNDLSISPSIGISFFPQHGMEVDALVRTADLAMYHAKQRGRGTYSVYAPELERRDDPTWSVEEKLKRALVGDGLVLHYQPVVDMKSGRLMGAEALLRLAAEEDRRIGPDLFIPVAEAAGLIGAVGEWVAAEACRQHGAWVSEGLPPVPIAINVSQQQFRLRRFAQRLSEIVAASGIDPSYLQLEVTESSVMENVPEAIDILNAIRSMGIKVALDDFGTGYSSLSYLGSLPLDKLKIDQSFVRRLDQDPASRAIIEAIIALGRTLSLEVVGEGIESDQTLAYLQAHGCDQGQGYFFARPMPHDEFARWYSRQLGVH